MAGPLASKVVIVTESAFITGAALAIDGGVTAQ
jgi:hypothetical protein